MGSEMKVLFVGAHFDDIELSAGGTVAKFVKQGHNVNIVVMTHSSYQYLDGGLRDIEDSQREGLAGLEVLGIKRDNIICLEYATEHITHSPKFIKSLDGLIKVIKPDLIITHHLNDSHQDHIATGKCVISASRYQKNIWMFEPLYPAKLSNIGFRAITYIDVSKTFDLKIEALKKHSSQWKKYPQWESLVLSLAVLRGVEIQAKYAEVFEPIKQLYE